MIIATTTTYEPVRAAATRKGRCLTCSKPVTRKRTFERTVSPFNKRDDGTQKSYSEVHVDVQALAAAWTPDAELFEHESCKAQRLAPARPAVIEPYRRPAEIRDRLVDTRDVLNAVSEVLTEFDLFAMDVMLRHGFRSFLVGHDDPITVDIDARVPAEFLRWMRRLPFETINAAFDNYDTTLRASVTYRGLRWRISGSLPQPPFGTRLPGLADDHPEIHRHRGKRITGATLTVAQLGKVVAALGEPTDIDGTG